MVSGAFVYYKNYVVNEKQMFDSSYRISGISKDAKGNIWLVSRFKGGLVCIDPATMQWNTYPVSEENKKRLGNEGLSCINPGDKKTVWFTNDAGLIRYDYGSDSLTFVTRKLGLLSDSPSGITTGENNNIFIVGRGGINLYKPQTNEIRSLRLNNENYNLSFAFVQYYDTIGRQLVYGLNDRILFIKDAVWQTASTGQLTYIDQIRVDNKAVPYPTSGLALSLSYSGKNVAISFASPSYADNPTIAYAYKMDGTEKDWTITTDLPVAAYTNLSPGSYVFMVKAKIETGDWGPVNDFLHINIAPPFWKTFWFVAAIILLVTASAFWLFRSRITTIRHEAGMKQRIAGAEMQALRAQMNPHFIFNCLNAIDNMIQTNQKQLATTYLSRFAKLIRGVLDSSKNNLVPLYKDVETLTLYLQLEQFRCNHNFEYSFTVDEELLHGDYKVPPLVVQPFIENAIHHGLLNKEDGVRQLSIHIALHNDDIKYTIADNGVGRTRAAFLKELNKPGHISYGIQISTDRINMHNRHVPHESITIKDLYDADKATGTLVEVIINSAG